MANIFEARGLSYRIGNKQILDGLDLTVDEREIHSIMGVNGTGKTTLASVIMGLEGYSPTAGELLFSGEDITRLSVTERGKRGISLAWQIPANFEGITVKDYLTLRNKGTDVGALLKNVGLSPELYSGREVDESLSGGERKRIELAAVMAGKPRLVVLDEPDSGIDIASIGIITKFIGQLKQNGASVLLITHNEKMASLGDRVSLLCGGKIVKEGKASQMAGFFEKYCKGCGHVGNIEEAKLNG